MKIRVRHFFPYGIFYFFLEEYYTIETVTEHSRRQKVAHIGQKKSAQNLDGQVRVRHAQTPVSLYTPPFFSKL